MKIEDIEKLEMDSVEIDPKQLLKIAKLVTELGELVDKNEQGYMNPSQVGELQLRVMGIDCQICQLLKDVLLDRITSIIVLMDALNFDKLNLGDKSKNII